MAVRKLPFPSYSIAILLPLPKITTPLWHNVDNKTTRNKRSHENLDLAILLHDKGPLILASWQNISHVVHKTESNKTCNKKVRQLTAQASLSEREMCSRQRRDCPAACKAREASTYLECPYRPRIEAEAIQVPVFAKRW